MHTHTMCTLLGCLPATYAPCLSSDNANDKECGKRMSSYGYAPVTHESSPAVRDRRVPPEESSVEAGGSRELGVGSWELTVKGDRGDGSSRTRQTRGCLAPPLVSSTRPPRTACTFTGSTWRAPSGTPTRGR
eukprot:1187114-Prorocentrum_minimum.AAC.2